MAAVAPTRKPLTSFTIESIVGRRSPPSSTTNVVVSETTHDDERTQPESAVTSSRFVPTVSVSFNGLSSADSAFAAALLHAGGPGFHCRPPMTPVALPNDDRGTSVNLGLCGRLFATGGRIPVAGVNAGNNVWSPGMTSPDGAGDAARRAVVAAAAAAMYSPGAWQSLQNAANRVCAEYMHHPFVGKLCNTVLH